MHATYTHRVAVCTSCGKEAPEDAHFCPACGTRLAGVVPAPELRKTVTVLFCDVAGSTAIGEWLDPERLRRLMLRFYEAMKEVCERHGGQVSELIGDAVMAAFGIPSVHEDDALRAVRAAAEMRERLEALSEELERDLGVRLRSRTGVNTGEVVVSERDPDRALVLGDAVNVAARLKQAAEPGVVLLGESTYMLVRDAVRAEPVEPLSLKGKSQRVPAFRLLDVLPNVSGYARRFGTPLVGREDELLVLRKAFERAVRDRRGYLVTVFGPAGIGKTRLAKELAASVAGEAAVLTGRCLSYGEGISYWPIREMVNEATGERPLADLLAGEDDANAVASRVAAAIGVNESAGLAEETFWAIRRLFEALALRKPLVLVFEDLHWAEPTLLDLVEHVPDSSRDAPILLFCLARPELLDKRPTWGGGRLSRSSGRARQKRRIGASREESGTCSTRSSRVGSAQCRSSNTSTSGFRSASASKSLRIAQKVSSARPALSLTPMAAATRLATASESSSPASRSASGRSPVASLTISLIGQYEIPSP